MGRLFGLVLFVVALYISAELYVKGADEAFGGVLAPRAEERNPVARTRRAADAFQRAYDQSQRRVDRALEHSDE